MAEKTTEKTQTTNDKPQADHVAAQQSAAGAAMPEWLQGWSQLTEATMAASRQVMGQFAGQFAGQVAHPFMAPMVAQAGKMMDDHKARMSGVEAEYLKAEKYGMEQMALAFDEMARLGKAGVQWYGTVAAQGRQQAHDAMLKAQEAMHKAQQTARAGVAS